MIFLWVRVAPYQEKVASLFQALTLVLARRCSIRERRLTHHIPRVAELKWLLGGTPSSIGDSATFLAAPLARARNGGQA